MIKATFTAGVPSATVHGLHQWDYGRQLQIIADGLPDLFEVHFECPGMKEAEVRLTELVDDVPTVNIPDRCLEQAAPIRAWVCQVNETSGRTSLEVILTVTPRLKPSAAGTAELEEEAGNKYDQLFGLMTEAYDVIEACKNVETNADEAQAAAEVAVTSATQAVASATAAEASAASAKASADSVADASLTLEKCFNKKGALLVPENDPNTERLGRFTLMPPPEGGRSFFYAFFIDVASGKTINLGVFVFNGVDTVEIPAPIGSYGMRVSRVGGGSDYVSCLATILLTDIYGNTYELYPNQSERVLYLQRLTN